MRKIILIVCILLVVSISASILTACNGLDFGNILDNAVWPYEDEADDEIILNFAAILGDVYVGKYACRVTIDEDGPGVLLPYTYTVTYIANKPTNKSRITYEKDAVKISVLTINTTTYYINEVTNTSSTSPTEEYLSVESSINDAFKYGRVEMNDAEDRIRWVCRSKTEDVEIVNSDGESESTIEFLYWDLEYPTEEGTGVLGEAGEKLTLNFRKVVTPMLEKLSYEVVTGSSPTYTVTKTIEVYPLFDYTYVPVDADFAIPA